MKKEVRGTYQYDGQKSNTTAVVVVGLLIFLALCVLGGMDTDGVSILRTILAWAV